MARTYLDDDFLLFSETARKLFYDTAKNLPIIDYHTHLPPDEVATNQRWENITDLWLGIKNGYGRHQQVAWGDK